jgi:hypothetical protein
VSSSEFVRPPARIALDIATGSYLASCLLGTSVALHVVDTRPFRWLHHAFYIATVATAATATLTLALRRDRAALALLGATPALIAVARVSARSKWHPVIGLGAAPAYVAARILIGR